MEIPVLMMYHFRYNNNEWSVIFDRKAHTLEQIEDWVNTVAIQVRCMGESEAILINALNSAEDVCVMPRKKVEMMKKWNEVYINANEESIKNPDAYKEEALKTTKELGLITNEEFEKLSAKLAEEQSEEEGIELL